MFPGGGAPGSRPLPRLQQIDPTSAEHDAEGRGSVRTGFHSAHQCGKGLSIVMQLEIVN